MEKPYSYTEMSLLLSKIQIWESFNTDMKKLLLLLFLIPNLVMADWRGWIYPNKENLSEYIVLGRFNSFDECKQTSLLNLKKCLTVIMNVGKTVNHCSPL